MQNTTRTFQIKDLGLIDYEEAYNLQKQLVGEVVAGAPQTLLLCEHPAVLTLGRLAKDEYVLWAESRLNEQGVGLFRIDRGGEVTLHAPGQLVIYPILDLNNYGRDLKRYLNKLEQVAIDLLHEFGILARRNPGQTGVWAGDCKVASIGIGVKKWVSYHGIAINVNTDLNLFSMIKPCGLDVEMTSLAKITGRPVDLRDVKAKAIACFEEVFRI